MLLGVHGLHACLSNSSANKDYVVQNVGLESFVRHVSWYSIEVIGSTHYNLHSTLGMESNSLTFLYQYDNYSSTIKHLCPRKWTNQAEELQAVNCSTRALKWYLQNNDFLLFHFNYVCHSSLHFPFYNCFVSNSSYFLLQTFGFILNIPFLFIC